MYAGAIGAKCHKGRNASLNHRPARINGISVSQVSSEWIELDNFWGEQVLTVGTYSRWIPKVSLLQRHPFTLISTHPATFVIQAQEGFTKALYLAACRNPGIKYRASIEGPYCVVPNTRGYEKVLLIAGGSGATFTIAVALEWARRYVRSKQRGTLDFVWIVRDKACLEWLDGELLELRASSGVSISLYVSGADSRPDEELPSSNTFRSLRRSSVSSSSVELQSWSSDEHEKLLCDSSSSQRTSSALELPESFKKGRPDLLSLVQDAVSGLKQDDRLLLIGKYCWRRRSIDPS